MEENKEVRVNEEKPVHENPPKLSYEELENVVSQLSTQNRQLYTRLQQAELTNVFKRLDYLFKVIENLHAFSEEFVKRCIAEVEDIMTPQEPENSESSDSTTDTKE